MQQSCQEKKELSQQTVVIPSSFHTTSFFLEYYYVALIQKSNTLLGFIYPSSINHPPSTTTANMSSSATTTNMTSFIFGADPSSYQVNYTPVSTFVKEFVVIDRVGRIQRKWIKNKKKKKHCPLLTLTPSNTVCYILHTTLYISSPVVVYLSSISF